MYSIMKCFYMYVYPSNNIGEIFLHRKSPQILKFLEKFWNFTLSYSLRDSLGDRNFVVEMLGKHFGKITLNIIHLESALF